MSGRARNPYAPLSYADGSARARAACSRWRLVAAALGATAPGRSWPRQAFAPDWAPPPEGASDGPPAWLEVDGSGLAAWREGEPPAAVGVVCDESWRPVEVRTRGGRRLPAADPVEEAVDPT